MNSARQAGHKGTPASRSSKRSKAKCTERVRTWAISLYPWGMTGWRYASIKGRAGKSRSTTAFAAHAGAPTGFAQHWQHARACKVSDLPPPPQDGGAF
jgi:hypothetical protein